MRRDAIGGRRDGGTYCAEIESRSDIRDMQSHGNALVARRGGGKISYGIGIFRTEGRTMERNAG